MEHLLLNFAFRLSVDVSLYWFPFKVYHKVNFSMQTGISLPRLGKM